VCGRFVQVSPPQQLAEQYAAIDVTDRPHRPRYNVAPSTEVPAIIDAGGRRLGMLRWGLVPSWSKDPASGPRPINARVEGVATSRLFSTPLRRQRCIVPVDGWYEWQDEDGAKQPSLLTAIDGAPAAIAGIWSTWRADPALEPLSTVALITTAATGTAARVHHRMPLRVPVDLLDAWLRVDTPEGELPSILAELVAHQPDAQVHRVSRRVNDVRNDDVGLLEPV
jgi:putative SOS response-associated peptidase YedK